MRVPVGEQEILEAVESVSREEIETLFAADTVLRRMGFPGEAQNLRAIAAVAIYASAVAVRNTQRKETQ